MSLLKKFHVVGVAGGQRNLFFPQKCCQKVRGSYNISVTMIPQVVQMSAVPAAMNILEYLLGCMPMHG